MALQSPAATDLRREVAVATAFMHSNTPSSSLPVKVGDDDGPSDASLAGRLTRVLRRATALASAGYRGAESSVREGVRRDAQFIQEQARAALTTVAQAGAAATEPLQRSLGGGAMVLVGLGVLWLASGRR